MIRFFKTPWIVRKWYPFLTWRFDCNDSIFLTFDDGPHPEATSWVLEQLDQYKAKATFFCLGKNITKYPETAKLVVDRGHTIGNHGFNHLNGWKTSDHAYLQDINACDDALDEIGIKTNLFRPPYGRIRKRQILNDKRTILWSYVSWDFDSGVSSDLAFRKLKKAKSGDIIVFHDSEKAFKNLKAILPQILSYFHSKGLKFEAIK